MTLPILSFSLRTISITESGWISHSATTMEDDSIPSVEGARRRNLNDLHHWIAKPPPPLFSTLATWKEPDSDMEVKIHETVILQDLNTGKKISERELEEYTIPYSFMENEEEIDEPHA